MNHPKPEAWVPYICGDITLTTRRELTAHLHDCPQCREEIETWKRSLKRLDSWKMPKVRRRSEPLTAPILKWAMAAAFVLLGGILIGRATAPTVDIDKLRSAIAPQIRRDLTSELAALAREEATKTASLTLASGRKYTEQVSAAYAQQTYMLLKKQIDTIAVNADEGLRDTAQQLFQLADYKQVKNPVDPNQ
jgi:hypothetical protein